MGPRDSQEHPRSKRTPSWENKTLKAIVYDPESHDISTEEVSILESAFLQPFPATATHTKSLEESDNFQVYLPSWRNRVDIYLNAESRSAFVATIRLDKQLSPSKNWQRRLRRNYKVLYVKGLRPEKEV